LVPLVVALLLLVVAESAGITSINGFCGWWKAVFHDTNITVNTHPVNTPRLPALTPALHPPV
jgi:hypothetical protein